MSLIIMNESKFHMWRACMAVIWLDSKLSKEELAWAQERIKALPFNPTQKGIIENDLKNGVSFEEVCGGITDKVDRAFLLHMVRVLGNLDKDYSGIEKETYQKLEKLVMAGLDLKEWTQKIEKMELDSYHEKEVYKTDNKASLFESVHRSFQKYANAGDYKLPKKT